MHNSSYFYRNFHLYDIIDIVCTDMKLSYNLGRCEKKPLNLVTEKLD